MTNAVGETLTSISMQKIPSETHMICLPFSCKSLRSTKFIRSELLEKLIPLPKNGDVILKSMF